MGLEVATNSAAVLPGLISGMNSLGSAVMYLIPVALTGFNFNNAIDFNKSNKVFFTSVEDALDRDIFQKMVVPLYQAITNNLFGDTFVTINSESASNKKEFLEKYEEAKQEKLKEIDFTFLDEAIDFQSAIKNIIGSRKNHLDFSKIKKDTKLFSIIAGVTGAISLFLLIASNITSFFFKLGDLSNIILVGYLLSVFISIFITGLYIKNKIKLDNFI